MNKWPQTIDKEKRIIDVIRRHRNKHGKSPTLAELAKALNMSPQAAAYHVTRMIKDGSISSVVVNGYTVPRTLRVIEDGD